MQAQIKKSELVLNGYAVDGNGSNSNQYAVMPFSNQEIATVFEKIDAFKNIPLIIPWNRSNNSWPKDSFTV